VADKQRPKEVGAINGGMPKRQHPIESVVNTLDVENDDAALERVSRSGGKVVRGRRRVGDIGLGAYVEDSEGNVMGLWQRARWPERPKQERGKPGGAARPPPETWRARRVGLLRLAAP